MLKKLWIFINLAFLISSCTTTSPWTLDSIAAGDRSFDSTRLRYINPTSNSPLVFEMRRISGHIDAYLNLNQFFLKSSTENAHSIMALFTIEGEQYEESCPLLEGRMRLKLSADTTERLTLALQKGKKVSILIDDFEEILEPDQFSHYFDEFIGKTSLFQNFFKGPIK